MTTAAETAWVDFWKRSRRESVRLRALELQAEDEMLAGLDVGTLDAYRTETAAIRADWPEGYREYQDALNAEARALLGRGL